MPIHHARRKGQSALEYLTTYGWAILIIVIILTALINLGIFNPSSLISTSCVFPAEFSCLNAVLYGSNGTVVLNILQDSDASISITALGCNNQSTATNMVKPYNPDGSNQITLGINSNYTFSFPCYSSGGSVVSLSPGTVYKTYILVNYTNLQTSFPHTIIGTLVAKVA